MLFRYYNYVDDWRKITILWCRTLHMIRFPVLCFSPGLWFTVGENKDGLTKEISGKKDRVTSWIISGRVIYPPRRPRVKQKIVPFTSLSVLPQFYSEFPVSDGCEQWKTVHRSKMNLSRFRFPQMMDDVVRTENCWRCFKTEGH